MDKYFRCFGLPGALVLTTLMSAVAFMLAVVFPTMPRWLCFAAMLMSSVGDIFLMHLTVIERRFKNFFLIGAGFFMVAHLLYAICYAVKIQHGGAALLNPGALIMAGIAVVFTLGFIAACRARGRMDQMPLITAYIALISLSCMMVFSYAWSQSMGNPLSLLAAVGAVSFFFSDLIIGMDLVMGGQRYFELIWWLYPIGQILLIVGIGRG